MAPGRSSMWCHMTRLSQSSVVLALSLLAVQLAGPGPALAQAQEQGRYAPYPGPTVTGGSSSGGYVAHVHYEEKQPGSGQQASGNQGSTPKTGEPAQDPSKGSAPAKIGRASWRE